MKAPSNISLERERGQLLSENFLHIRFLLSFLLHHKLFHAIVLGIIQLKRKAPLSICLTGPSKGTSFSCSLPRIQLVKLIRQSVTI